MGTSVTLLSESGDELATWTTDEKPHRLIRVPEGEYSLKIDKEGQTDKVSFTVGREQSLQEIQIKTFLPGVVDKNERQGLSFDMRDLLPYAAGGFVAIAGLIVLLLVYRDSRKRSGGHR